MSRCKEIREKLRRGEGGADVEQHLLECASCAAFADAYPLLKEADVVDSSIPFDGDEAFKAIERRLGKQLPAQRFLAEQPTAIRLAVIAAVSFLMLVVIWFFSRRVDWTVYPMLRWWLEAGGNAAVISMLLLFAVRSLHLPRPAPWRPYLAVLLSLVVMALPFVLSLAHHDHPESLKGVGDDLAYRAAKCFEWGVAVSAAVGIPAFWVSRGARGLGNLRGSHLLAMGLFAVLALHLHCPLVHPLHIGLGHTAIVPVLLLGYLVAARHPRI